MEEQLLGMGFDAAQVTAAMAANPANIDAAMELLFRGSAPPAAPSQEMQDAPAAADAGLVGIPVGR